MKLIIASDIHGSAHWCKRLISAFEAEKADRMLLLGDILYHGPRNDLPEDYAPKKVTEILNTLKDKLFCVRGNCDTEVDQMVLDFPIMADYCVIPFDRRVIYATHGHIYNKDNLPPFGRGDILLYGHTHVPECTESDKCVCINPGSVSIPKEGTPNSFIVFDSGEFLWKELETGRVFKKYKTND